MNRNLPIRVLFCYISMFLTVSECTLYYDVDDAMTSVRRPHSFQEKLLYENKNSEEKGIALNIMFGKRKQFERYQSDCLLPSAGSHLVFEVIFLR